MKWSDTCWNFVKKKWTTSISSLERSVTMTKRSVFFTVFHKLFRWHLLSHCHGEKTCRVTSRTSQRNNRKLSEIMDLFWPRKRQVGLNLIKKDLARDRQLTMWLAHPSICISGWSMLGSWRSDRFAFCWQRRRQNVGQIFGDASLHKGRLCSRALLPGNCWRQKHWMIA